MGAGVGVIGLLLAQRHPTVRVTGIELDPDLARHAAQNVKANALGQRVAVLRADLRQAPRFLPPGHFHRVVANPPFRTPGSGAASPLPARARARAELTLRLADLAASAAALLRCGGRFDLIHLAERLPQLFLALAAAALEPKRLRLVAPHHDAAPRLCLVSAVKGGRPGLHVLPQLVVHERSGRYTDEVAALLQPTGQAGVDK